jgi:hypothetical protein
MTEMNILYRIVLRSIAAAIFSTAAVSVSAQDDNSALLRQWGLPNDDATIASPPKQQSGTSCYSISRADKQPDTILVNQCSGQTWILARSPVSDKKGAWTYVWNPIPLQEKPGVFSAEQAPPIDLGTFAVKPPFSK